MTTDSVRRAAKRCGPALALAVAALSLAPPAALAAPTSPTDVADTTLTVGDLLPGDTVSAYLIADADIDAANNLTYTMAPGLPAAYDTLDEIAAILTRVSGRPVTYVRETVKEAYESRKKWPAAQWQYDSWVSTYTSIARGEMDVVSTTVRDVTGRDPLTFEEVARAALASGR